MNRSKCVVAKQAVPVESAGELKEEVVATLQKAPDSPPAPTAEQRLKYLAGEISLKLAEGAYADILAGYLLHQAREIIKENGLEDWKGCFEEFQSKLGLSRDKAYRLIRSVERWVAVLDWEGEDSRITELANIGSCRLDEIQKLDDALWGFDDDNRLVVYGAARDGEDLPLSTLSFREIKEYRQGLVPDAEVDGAERGDGDGGEGEDGGVSGDCGEDGGDADGGDDDGDGSEASSNGADAYAASTNRPADPDAAQNEVWDFATCEKSPINVFSGKLRATGEGQLAEGAEVYGFNVQLRVEGGVVVAELIDSGEDAFYTFTVRGNTQVYWFDHKRPDASWQRCLLEPVQIAEAQAA